MKNILIKVKALAVAGMTMGLALGAKAENKVMIGEFKEKCSTNFTFTASVVGNVDTVWFDVTNAYLGITKASETSHAAEGWQWSFDKYVYYPGKITAITSSWQSAKLGKVQFDAFRLIINADSEVTCNTALKDALSYLIIGNVGVQMDNKGLFIYDGGEAILNAKPEYKGAKCVVSTAKIPEIRSNVVDTLDDVVDRDDGKHSLREVVTDYAYAWDNASNVVIGVSASEELFGLSSDLTIASNLTMSANTAGAAGLVIKDPQGDIIIEDGVSVTIDCKLNIYAVGSDTNCLVLGTNACVRMAQKFVTSPFGCNVKSTEDLLEKGAVKIFEPATTWTDEKLENIRTYTYVYDPEGKGYTTVVRDGAIYLASPVVRLNVGSVTDAEVVAYTNDVPITGEQPYLVERDAEVSVVYTATEGKMFPGGYKTLTTNVTASAAVMVTLAAAEQPVAAKECEDCLTFSASEAFGIKMGKSGSPKVNPSLEYSTDKTYWQTFDKDQGAKAADTGTGYQLYLRGSGNKGTASSRMNSYTFTTTSDSVATAIACSGNIETILDYETVAAGDHPEMGEFAFYDLFNNFAALTDLPELPATNLTENCYESMFSGCSSLVVNTNAPGKAWLIPAEAKVSQGWNDLMFSYTSGDITNTTVEVGVKYYVFSALPPEPILTDKIVAPDHTTAAVYTNGVLSSETTGVAGVWNAWSNETAMVVYTVTDTGYYFENGATAVTNALDTSKNPAPVAGEVPVQPGTPKVILGVVAQRYPWNGTLDVEYKTPYANASHTVTFSANGTVLGTANGTGGQEATASFDLNTAADGAFKNKALKGVKITATIK